MWIKEKSEKAVSGDLISIMLIAHGRWGSSGGILLGTKFLSPNQLAAALDGLKSGVEVYLRMTSCYSGMFTDKIRATRQLN